MQYCKKCILPDTRPNLILMEDGMCNACHNWIEKKEAIDWGERERSFKELTSDIKKQTATWDCVIPVSGGKDSTWQVIKALEYGLKPLCVTWRTPARSALGQKNLDNLIHLGVDHIDFSINPHLEKKFVLKTFRRLGTLAIPMHMALFAIPLQVAINYRIPLVIWGENSGMEYGGTEDTLLGVQMTLEWLKTYGVTHGTTAEDWVGDDLTLKELSPYRWPNDGVMQEVGVTACFLGWYFSWDPHNAYRIAQEHGFQSAGHPQVGFYNFADVDDEFIIPIHHWLKWYKFGFTRLYDNLSIEIRMGRKTREEAVNIINKKGEEYPEKAINKFCDWSNLSLNEFQDIADSFRNKNVWNKIEGRWAIKCPLSHG